MRRTAVLTALASAATLVAGTLTTAVAASAPPDPGPGPQGPVAAPRPGPPAGDADRDRVSDDFEAALAAAAPSDRFRVIVEGLRPGAARSRVGAFAVRFDLPLIQGFSATMTAAQVRGLLRAPGLTRVSRVGVVRALDDAGNRDFGVEAARTERTWLDGSGVGICVVDTGVDPAHEQLSGRVAGFFDAVNGRATAYDDHGHGTHVAAIAAGAGPAEYRGVAPGAAVHAAKVLSSAGTGSNDQVVAGVEWCAQREGVRVISMSLGDTAPSDGTDPLSNAVNAAVAGGDVVVVAAGNSGDGPRTINAPGVAADVITVGAASDHSAPVGTARRDDGIWLAAFSSRGPALRPGGKTAT
ncbi:MAG TPA: S8 family serine peptidase, partial [Nocardioides sp.]|nr:S8 family serine peptidase [Nocardioides sp.]